MFQCAKPCSYQLPPREENYKNTVPQLPLLNFHSFSIEFLGQGRWQAIIITEVMLPFHALIAVITILHT